MAGCLTLGCTGQNLPGRWRGPFPLDGADAAVLTLYGDRRFDLTCERDRWIGGGTYDRTNESIRFDFGILMHRGEKVPKPPTIECGFEGKGNEIVLRLAGKSYSLLRKIG